MVAEGTQRGLLDQSEEALLRTGSSEAGGRNQKYVVGVNMNVYCFMLPETCATRYVETMQGSLSATVQPYRTLSFIHPQQQGANVSVDSHHHVDHDRVGEPLPSLSLRCSYDRAAGSGWSTGCETTCKSACAAGLLREGMRLLQWMASASRGPVSGVR